MKNLDFRKINKYLRKDVANVFKRKNLLSKRKKERKINFSIIVVIVVFFLLGIGSGLIFQDFLQENIGEAILEIKSFLDIPQSETQHQPFQSVSQDEPYSGQTSQEKAVINVVKKASPAVVSILIFEEVPIYKEYYVDPFEDMFDGQSPFSIQIPEYRQEGTERKQVGGGTGFIVSEDGLILTNKHVVLETDAEYLVVSSEGKRYKTKVLARDPFQDLAILKIEKEISNGQEIVPLAEFPILKLGDSSLLEIGQSVVAIGNALGEFSNTVSVGVISGLSRRITASGGGLDETLENVIQTDAAINKGNSGGPLLNLRGEVIGINVAIAEEAQSIGFSIPINKAKRDIIQVKQIGKIVYPFLGVRYVLITPEIQEQEKLEVDYGALLVAGSDASEPAVLPGSAGARVGLKEGDIILKIDGQKINLENSLSEIIQEKNPGDKVILDVLRDKINLKIEVILGEKTSEN